MVAIAVLATLAAATFSTLAAATPTPLERARGKLEGQYVAGAGAYVNTHGCPGVRIDDGPVGKSGKMGHWWLYYSSAKGGTNCLYVDNKSGKPQWIWARLEEVNSYALHYVFDAGYYKSYAGSVRLHNMAGKCLRLFAQMGDGDGEIAHDKKGKPIQGVEFHCK